MNASEIADVVGPAIAVTEVVKSLARGRSIAVRTTVKVGNAKTGRLALLIGRRTDGGFVAQFAARGGWMRQASTVRVDQIESLATKEEIDGRPIQGAR